MLETTVIICLWFIVAPVESQVFALLSSTLIFVFLASLVLFRTLMVAFFVISPLLLPEHQGRNWRNPSIPILCLVLLVALTVDVFAILIQVALTPVLESMSTIYTNNDTNLASIQIMVVVSLVFASLVITPRVIDSLLLPRRTEQGLRFYDRLDE
jgi:hypothetical protein